MEKEEPVGRFSVIQGGLDDDSVVDFEVKQAEQARAPDLKPSTLLKMALLDAQSDPNINRAYITLIRENADGSLTLVNYRAGMNTAEEIAYRQVGVSEAIEGFKEPDDAV